MKFFYVYILYNKDKDFIINTLFSSKNINTILISDIEKQIAKDNGICLKDYFDLNVILGYKDRTKC